ncbi:lysylphosphatidylglycerol synthase domain-containing protein [Aridibaculum aurantiacum]|uniref:lysylphosphatidylglycerol synthase domain-containing protein n=1 Tax=Aridibaculum aurantiacum TaxID=2810307 RepID=UPI001A9682D1|nr:lysylphosphatidylglycerol synthase domain-containing protein [Aridibaculum aurantiacum]
MNQPDWKVSWLQIKESFTGQEAWKPILVILLMVFNWSFEAIKWRVLVKHIQPISFFTSFKAILSGLSVSLALNTPNGAGEYVGRVLYVKEGNRIRTIAITFVGSISQLIITLLMGTIGLFILNSYFDEVAATSLPFSIIWLDAIMYLVLSATVALSVLYFKISWLIKLLERIPIIKKYSFFIQKLEEFGAAELLKVLLLSLARYVIFVVQYLLLLQLFKVEISLATSIWLITAMFLALAIVPTIALAELGIRGKLSIYIFGLFSSNTLGIVLTASTIWLINLVVPAVAGSLFILGIKLFRNR